LSTDWTADTKLPCPDLLLLDLYLPKRDGNEVLAHLRASQRCGQIPVVFLTSSDATWDRENAAKNYATHYFQKTVVARQVHAAWEEL
jgi:CheY-like chemotaxis protein